jgi:hypothetical protein
MTAMGTRSFYLSPAAEKAIAVRSSGGSGRGGDRSGAVEAMLTRYDAIVHADKPDLSATDWKVLRDALRHDDRWPAYVIATLPEMVAHWLDLQRRPNPQLILKIRGLSGGQRAAVIDEVERYWLEHSS